MFIDTHCHLDLFSDIQDKIAIEDAMPIKTISVTNAPYLFKPNAELFKDSKNIRIALGMHPELVTQFGCELDEFEKHLTETKYVGEIGLDGSENHKGSFVLQKQVFEKILSLIAGASPKILTIHSRNAASETVDLLIKHLRSTNSKVILHWYSGDKVTLSKAIDNGFFFSINHKMTNSEKGNSIVQSLPLDRILTETDTPFTFSRSVNNRLLSLNDTVAKISGLKHKPFEEIKQSIFNNFKKILS